MNIEIVTTCVNYADFLSHTLPVNLRAVEALRAFNHHAQIIVATSPEDAATQRLCDYWDVDCVVTDEFRSVWGEFHKAKGINAGLSLCERSDWLLHLDSDIALPPLALKLIAHANLDPTCIYGVDRQCIPSFAAWSAHQAQPVLQHDSYHIRPPAFDLAPRFGSWHVNGYAPPGFFQLWNAKSGIVDYTPATVTALETAGGADRTDILQATRWPAEPVRKRHLLPDFIAYHLESQKADQGINWYGRQSVRFGPEPSAPVDSIAHRRHPSHRHHHHRPYRAAAGSNGG